MITATGGWDWPPGCESSLCYDRVALQYLLYTFYGLCLKRHSLFCIDIKAGSSYLLRLTLFMLPYWELLSKGFAEFIVCDAYGRRQGYTTDERGGCHGGLWDEYGCGMDTGHQSKPIETHEEGEMVGATGFA